MSAITVAVNRELNGRRNKAEIWDRTQWTAYQRKQAAPSFEKLAKDLDI